MAHMRCSRKSYISGWVHIHTAQDLKHGHDNAWEHQETRRFFGCCCVVVLSLLCRKQFALFALFCRKQILRFLYIFLLCLPFLCANFNRDLNKDCLLINIRLNNPIVECSTNIFLKSYFEYIVFCAIFL
jgi:hypothetical protein